ncbi:unnamed protein product [Cladocopium goreaui]|uniref:Carbonyl reductase [NADPH] 3 (NADPH-dependen t carbonyl reductase 3) (Quinone reductase CBR3) n=1 Tax=Cladocopium goreaui TaxID=2562237 RepID=A0A9P1GQJ3_9DINO|nr:unnamed protein product [Cladocopium goreaui]
MATLWDPAERHGHLGPLPGQRLVLVTGAARGLGVGICKQVLQQADAELIVAARSLPKAQELADELGPRCRALQCDVSDEASCRLVAETVAKIRGSRALSVVHNAGVAYDLPWFPAPWPVEAARVTLGTNLFGAMRLTEALLPELLDERAHGRLVFVSSGAGAANLSKMAEERRCALTTIEDVKALKDFCEAFIQAYEASAKEQAEVPLPKLQEGFWLQSNGFSKACLNRYCQMMALQHPTLCCVACSPGFVETEMVKTYRGDSKLKSVEEGGDVCAWLALSPDAGPSGVKTPPSEGEGQPDNHEKNEGLAAAS